MCFSFKKITNGPVNHFLQDGASAGIWSLQPSIAIKLCQHHGTDFNLSGTHGCKPPEAHIFNTS